MTIVGGKSANVGKGGSSRKHKTRSRSGRASYLNGDNEDVCGACNKGGKLLCCEGCPASYHVWCAGYADEGQLTKDEWYCWSCCKRLSRQFEHPTRPCKARVGDKIMIASDSKIQEIFYSGKVVSASQQKIAVSYDNFKPGKGNPESLLRTSNRIWHGTLDDRSWMYMGKFAWGPNSRCLAIDMNKVEAAQELDQSQQQAKVAKTTHAKHPELRSSKVAKKTNSKSLSDSQKEQSQDKSQQQQTNFVQSVAKGKQPDSGEVSNRCSEDEAIPKESSKPLGQGYSKLRLPMRRRAQAQQEQRQYQSSKNSDAQISTENMLQNLQLDSVRHGAKESEELSSHVHAQNAQISQEVEVQTNVCNVSTVEHDQDKLMQAKEGGVTTKDSKDQSHVQSGEETFYEALIRFYVSQSKEPPTRTVVSGNWKLDLYQLWQKVAAFGGFESVITNKLWATVADSFHPPASMTTKSTRCKLLYQENLLNFEIACRENQTNYPLPPTDFEQLHRPKRGSRTAPDSPFNASPENLDYDDMLTSSTMQRTPSSRKIAKRSLNTDYLELDDKELDSESDQDYDTTNNSNSRKRLRTTPKEGGQLGTMDQSWMATGSYISRVVFSDEIWDIDVGSEIEITSNEDGYKGAWFKGKVLDVCPAGEFEGGRCFLVEYLDFSWYDNDEENHICEWVPFLTWGNPEHPFTHPKVMVRKQLQQYEPRETINLENNWQVGMTVETFQNGTWWMSKILSISEDRQKIQVETLPEPWGEGDRWVTDECMIREQYPNYNSGFGMVQKDYFSNYSNRVELRELQRHLYPDVYGNLGIVCYACREHFPHEVHIQMPTQIHEVVGSQNLKEKAGQISRQFDTAQIQVDQASMSISVENADEQKQIEVVEISSDEEQGDQSDHDENVETSKHYVDVNEVPEQDDETRNRNQLTEPVLIDNVKKGVQVEVMCQQTNQASHQDMETDQNVGEEVVEQENDFDQTPKKSSPDVDVQSDNSNLNAEIQVEEDRNLQQQQQMQETQQDTSHKIAGVAEQLRQLSQTQNPTSKSQKLSDILQEIYEKSRSRNSGNNRHWDQEQSIPEKTHEHDTRVEVEIVSSSNPAEPVASEIQQQQDKQPVQESTISLVDIHKRLKELHKELDRKSPTANQNCLLQLPDQCKFDDDQYESVPVMAQDKTLQAGPESEHLHQKAKVESPQKTDNVSKQGFELKTIINKLIKVNQAGTTKGPILPALPIPSRQRQAMEAARQVHVPQQSTRIKSHELRSDQQSNVQPQSYAIGVPVSQAKGMFSQQPQQLSPATTMQQQQLQQQYSLQFAHQQSASKDPANRPLSLDKFLDPWLLKYLKIFATQEKSKGGVQLDYAAMASGCPQQDDALKRFLDSIPPEKRERVQEQIKQVMNLYKQSKVRNDNRVMRSQLPQHGQHGSLNPRLFPNQARTSSQPQLRQPSIAANVQQSTIARHKVHSQGEVLQSQQLPKQGQQPIGHFGDPANQFNQSLLSNDGIFNDRGTGVIEKMRADGVGNQQSVKHNNNIQQEQGNLQQRYCSQ